MKHDLKGPTTATGDLMNDLVMPIITRVQNINVPEEETKEQHDTRVRQLNNIKTDLQPAIANFVHERQQKVLENEHWNTIYILANNTPPQCFGMLMNKLQYSIKRP